MSEAVNENKYDLSSVSSGVAYIQQGYIDYAKTVITERALPNFYDGLKPVNRRILFTLFTGSNKKSYRKCARIVGDVMGIYHPHGDSSIYEALVLMTQKYGGLAFPLVEGSGAFGSVYSTDKPAAMRYTEARLHPFAEEYFGEMNGIEMIPNFDSTSSEPVVLPVRFPSVLVNSTSGIAVGFKSNIPSFNFSDVCDLVTEYIKDGSCHTIIYPDFVTGGYYVKDDKEMEKIMKHGRGKIKLRGKSVVVGKEIQFTEVPFGKTIQGLVKQVNDANLSCVRNAYDTQDRDHGAGFTIDCTSKSRVEEAMYKVYKNTDIQYNYNADITVIKDNIPHRMGVWELIEAWVAERREILIKEYNVQINGWKERAREATAFMTIVNDYDKRMKLVEIIASKGRSEGRDYIRNNFTREEVPEDLIDFCASRSLPSYHDGGKYANDFTNADKEIKRYQGYIDDIDKVILDQIADLKRTYGSQMQRRTEITETNYEFAEGDEEEQKIVDNSSCYYSFKNGFLKKMKYASGDKDAQYEFGGFANDTLIAFDNRGRLLRVYCQDLPMHGNTELGIYVPRYCGLDETDDYKITWIGRMYGQELMLIYKDGNVGFVDTSEWIGNNRNVKVLEKGISVACADKLGAVLEEIPNVLMVTDESGRVAWTTTSDIKHKDRTAKTRVFNITKTALLDSYSCQNVATVPSVLDNADQYFNKLKELNPSDFVGDDSDFIMMF